MWMDYKRMYNESHLTLTKWKGNGIFGSDQDEPIFDFIGRTYLEK